MSPTASAAKKKSSAKGASSAKGGFDPRVTEKIAAAPAFARPILEHIRATVHDAVPTVTEDIKWSRPFFVLDGQALCNMAAFSQHCSFGFWSAKMTDLLVKEGIDGSEAGGSFGRLTSVDDLPPRRKLVEYIRAAACLIANGDSGAGAMGERRAKTPKAAIAVPEDFAGALARSKSAKANFDAMPPGARRDYLEWITTAKRQETRDRRVQEAVAKIADGRRMNEEYRSK
jgi:hypothetical protein